MLSISAIFFLDELDILELADEKKLQQLRDDREPFDAPSTPPYFTPKPGKHGKVFWFSGATGSGKSTSAQLMGRHHGCLYYEGDAFGLFVNP